MKDEKGARGDGGRRREEGARKELRVSNEALEMTSIINCANLFLLNKNSTY